MIAETLHRKRRVGAVGQKRRANWNRYEFTPACHDGSERGPKRMIAAPATQMAAPIDIPAIRPRALHRPQPQQARRQYRHRHRPHRRARQRPPRPASANRRKARATPTPGTSHQTGLPSRKTGPECETSGNFGESRTDIDKRGRHHSRVVRRVGIVGRAPTIQAAYEHLTRFRTRFRLDRAKGHRPPGAGRRHHPRRPGLRRHRHRGGRGLLQHRDDGLRGNPHRSRPMPARSSPSPSRISAMSAPTTTTSRP